MSYDHDLIIVGGGIFGSVIAAKARSLGMDTLLLDDNRPMAGSKPAACLMKPGWFSSMDPRERDASLKLLDEQFKVHDIQFKIWPKGSATVHWCDPASILAVPRELATVEAVKENKVWISEERHSVTARHVIVAAGVWCNRFMEKGDIVQPKGGWAMRGAGQLEHPFIRPYAPYKQLVAFNISGGEIWVGDGAALKPESMSDARMAESVKRMGEHIPGGARTIAGLRPYVKLPKSQPCLLERARNGVWLATGGAKNGTIAAGWAAHQLFNEGRLERGE